MIDVLKLNLNFSKKIIKNILYMMDVKKKYFQISVKRIYTIYKYAS